VYHSIQAAFNKTIISIFEKKLPLSNVSKPSHKLNSLQQMTQFEAEQPEYIHIKIMKTITNKRDKT